MIEAKGVNVVEKFFEKAIELLFIKFFHTRIRYNYKNFLGIETYTYTKMKQISLKITELQRMYFASRNFF